MKKISIFGLLLFLAVNCFSQNLEKIKKSEVLFILHNGTNGKYQSKRILQKYKDKRTSFFYDFFFTDENHYSLQNEKMTFTYSQYYDFDQEYEDNPVPYFKINRSFLKKNKDLIVTGNFMKRIGYIESIKLIDNAKTIFLIDKSEIEDRNILIKEVSYFELSIE